MVLGDNDQLRRASQSQPHSREQPDTEAGDDAPDNHDPESRSESLNGTTDSKDNGADEERASSANDVANPASSDRGDCGVRARAQNSAQLKAQTRFPRTY